MTIQEMKKKKAELGYTYEQISKRSGVPLGTVQKVFCGVTTTPRYDTIQALEKVFCDSNELSQIRESEAAYGYYSAPHSDSGSATCPYFNKNQGEYTLDDYYKIPDENRVELIDGVIYDMSAPTSAHQLIAGYIYARLLSHVISQKGDCLPMISPLDVQLDCDNKTMIQPDVIIVCDRDKVINRCVYGAPDFVIEVLSKSTRKKDAIIKLNKYLNAGVKEYWMIDPIKLRVLVYNFDGEDEIPKIYGFTDKVPVRIWDDGCVIDFQEVYDYIRFLYERPED